MPQEIFSADWPKVIESIGIIGSLWLGIRTASKDSEDRQITNLQAMAARSDALWEKIRQDPKLKRILAYDVNLAQPPTVEEEECLIQIFKLFQDGWRVASATDKYEVAGLGRDIADFLKRPLACAFWENEKAYKNPRFVRFVKRAIEASGPLKPAGHCEIIKMPVPSVSSFNGYQAAFAA